MNLRPVIFVILQTGVGANGGIASISQIIECLQRHRPIIVTDRESARTEEWRKAGFATHVVPQTISAGSLRHPAGALSSYLRYSRELRRLVKRSGARVIHANDPAAMQLAIAPAKLTGAKLVLNIRGTFDPEQPPSQLKYGLLFALADHVLYLSNDMARRWAAHVPNAASSFSVTYSIADPSKFRPSPIGSDEKPIVLVSGLVRPLKGQLEFIMQSAPALVGEGIQIRFVGDFDPSANSYMAACAKAAEPFGDAVQFLGFRNDVAQLMAESAVVAVPSRHEGLVRAMIEAMSCGRPVVSFDVCSAREILEEESGGAGSVVQGGDHKTMTEAIIGYCKRRAVASAAGEKGCATAERLFARDAVVERYERVYEVLDARMSAAVHGMIAPVEVESRP